MVGLIRFTTSALYRLSFISKIPNISRAMSFSSDSSSLPKLLISAEEAVGLVQNRNVKFIDASWHLQKTRLFMNCSRFLTN